MDFELSEEQELMRRGLRELLERHCSTRRVREVAVDGDGTDPSLWRALAEAGWTGVSVPEALGGMGQGFESLMLVAIEAGRALLPLPLTGTLLAARVLSRSPQGMARDNLLRGIVGSSTSIGIALRGAPEEWNGERPRCTATPSGDGWRLDGGLTSVPYGPLAGATLLEADLSTGGRNLFLMPAETPGVQWKPLESLDLTTRRFDLKASAVELPGSAALFGGGDMSSLIDELSDEYRIVLAAESLGACERLLEMTAAYAKERVQFGRPIGVNQAVKVRIAEMAVTVERIRAAVYQAALRIEEQAEARSIAVHLAKAAASAPGAFIGTQAIHIHGGIGFTWEHDAHLYFKRVKSNELLLGDTATSLARLADLVLSGESERRW